MSLILATSAIRKMKKAGKDINDFAKIPEIQRIKTKYTLEEIKEILAKDYIFRKSKVQTEDEVLKLSKGRSWESWGEIVTITLLSQHNDEYEYEITSRPKFKLTLVDYGKNYKNVKNIISILSPLPKEEENK